MWIIKACHRWNNYMQPVKDEGRDKVWHVVNSKRWERARRPGTNWFGDHGGIITCGLILSRNIQYTAVKSDPGAVDEWRYVEWLIISEHIKKGCSSLKVSLLLKSSGLSPGSNQYSRICMRLFAVSTLNVPLSKAPFLFSSSPVWLLTGQHNKRDSVSSLQV